MTMNNRFPIAMIVLFGVLFVVCVIGCFWNIWQLVNAIFCLIMVLAAIKDLKE